MNYLLRNATSIINNQRGDILRESFHASHFICPMRDSFRSFGMLHKCLSIESWTLIILESETPKSKTLSGYVFTDIDIFQSKLISWTKILWLEFRIGVLLKNLCTFSLNFVSKLSFLLENQILSLTYEAPFFQKVKKPKESENVITLCWAIWF